MKCFLTSILSILIIGNFYSQVLDLDLHLSYTSDGSSSEPISVFVSTNPEYISASSNPVLVLPESITTVSYVLPYNNEYELTLIYACGEDSVVIPVQIENVDSAYFSINVALTCMGNGVDWDCPNLNSNIEDPCQSGWGIVDEDCDCVEVETSCLEGVNVDNLLDYFIAECANPANPDAWFYCGLQETLFDAIESLDEEACAEILDWIENNDWTDEFDCPELEGNVGDYCIYLNGTLGEISEDCECVEIVLSEWCVADFSVVQAYEENNVIPFELFVYLWDYDSSNDYYWSFGDEGSSTDPFPTWIYETNGPYVLCLTVSNEEDSCSTTYCQNIEVDSLGWIDGIQDGFTINVLNGDDNPISGIGEIPEDVFSFSVFPNPIIGSEVQVNWLSNSLNNVESTIMSLDGKIVARNTSGNPSTGSSMTINIDKLSPGLYILQVSQGFRTQSKTVIIR